MKSDYVKNPNNKSQLLMNQNRKYWAKNDKILLADKSREPAPLTDSFKTCHIPIKMMDNVTEKELHRNWSITKG